MHVTGNTLRHRDSLHFLWGKHLQCTKFLSVYVYSRPYVYSLCQIFLSLRLFPALRLLRTLEYYFIHFDHCIDSPISVVILEEKDSHVNFEPDVLLTLTCQANDAKPPANIVWKIDNKNFSSNYTGNITLL